MAENKQLLGGLYVQDQYEVDGTPESVSTNLKKFCIYSQETYLLVWLHRI